MILSTPFTKADHSQPLMFYPPAPSFNPLNHIFNLPKDLMSSGHHTYIFMPKNNLYSLLPFQHSLSIKLSLWILTNMVFNKFTKLLICSVIYYPIYYPIQCMYYPLNPCIFCRTSWQKFNNKKKPASGRLRKYKVFTWRSMWDLGHEPETSSKFFHQWISSLSLFFCDHKFLISPE